MELALNIVPEMKYQNVGIKPNLVEKQIKLLSDKILKICPQLIKELKATQNNYSPVYEQIHSIIKTHVKQLNIN